MRFIFLIKHYPIIALVSNMEVWYGHDRKISEMLDLEKIFNQICIDYNGYKYAGWIKIGLHRYFCYGVQLRIEDARLVAYFLKDFYGYRYLYIKLRNEIDWVFFYGSENQKLTFDIGSENFLYLSQRIKDGEWFVDKRDHGLLNKQCLFFLEEIVKKYNISETGKASVMPG